VLLDLVGIGICCALEKSFKQRQVIVFWVSGFLWRLSTCQKQSQDKFTMFLQPVTSLSIRFSLF